MRSLSLFLAALVLSAGQALSAGDVDIVSPNVATGETAATGTRSLAETGNLWQTAKTASKGLSLFVKAVEAAGLDTTLVGPEPYTVLAPNDRAFYALGNDTLDVLFAPRSQDQLRQMLNLHILRGSHRIETMRDRSIPTLAGSSWIVQKRLRDYVVGPATVSKANIPASNGTLHIIDRVLVAAELRQAPR